MGPTVVALNTSSVAPEQMHRCIEQVGLIEKLQHADNVVVKPNLAAGNRFNWQSGVVVSPQMVKAVVQAIGQINATAKVWIAESDSSGGCLASDKFKFQGYLQLARSLDSQVQLLDLSRDAMTRLSHQSRILQPLLLSKRLCECDVLISLSKIKTHRLTGFSGALKNHFGLLPDPDKEKYHPFLAEVIADLIQARPADMYILDGNPAMEGAGPVYGSPRAVDTVLVATDPVAIDTIASRLIGLSPGQIRHLRYAASEGLGCADPEQIRIIGDLAPCKPKFCFISTGERCLIGAGLGLLRLSWLLQKLGALLCSGGHPRVVVSELWLAARRRIWHRS